MDFERVYEIMKTSFSPNLFRAYNEQKKLFEEGKYKIKCCEKNGTVIGFLSFWLLNGFVYIEHLAVDKEFRGGGEGGRLLESIISEYKNVVLEAEPPKTKEDSMRINFYKRHGLFLNSYDYLQPPYREGFSHEKLFIMSSQALDRKEFLYVVSEIYENVYNRSIKDYKIYTL